MKVFLSWSGIRSKHVAEALRSWLPKVIQAAKPWMSDEDIATGMRWSAEISTQLETTQVGIICVTPENQHKPWVMFEAGALSKTISQAYVCPYLIDLTPSQLAGPLAQFQSSVANREGTSKILHTLNKALGSSQISPQELDDIFEVWWPRLEQQLQTLPAHADERIVIRSRDEILEEIVQNTREQLQREKLRLEHHVQREEKIDGFLALMESMMSQYSRSLTPDVLPALRHPGNLKQGTLAEMFKGMSIEDVSDAVGKFENLRDQSLQEFPQMLERLRELQADAKEQTKKLLDDAADSSDASDDPA